MLTLRGTSLVVAATLTTLITLMAPVKADSGRLASKYAEEGHSAGLTEKEIVALQREVDKEISATGGRQIALNKIALNDGEIGIPVPGDKRVLDLAASEAKHVKVYASCRRGNFCGWKGRNGTGKDWQVGACNKFHEIPDGWNSGGSWQNYQSDGLVAEFYGKGHNYLSPTPPAPTGIVNGDWHPVWYVWACTAG